MTAVNGPLPDEGWACVGLHAPERTIGRQVTGQPGLSLKRQTRPAR